MVSEAIMGVRSAFYPMEERTRSRFPYPEVTGYTLGNKPEFLNGRL
jgi:hypothetical protein